MNILCVIDSLGSGGAQRQLVELAKGFKDKGHVVSFLTYHALSFYNETLENQGIGIVCIEEPNYLLRLWKMRRFIRKGEFDAVLSFLEAANFICEVAGLPSRKWKLVVGERNANPAIMKSVKLRSYRWFHFFTDYVVANSNANMQMVLTINPLLKRQKCKVIYNIVDMSKWLPLLEYVPRKNRVLQIVVAARYEYQKNVEGMIEAVNLLNKEERMQLHIEWFGANFNLTKEKAVLKTNKYKLDDYLIFYDETHEICKKIQQADVVGLFSFYEGLPNVVCEGMSAGKPIIASTVSDVPLLISDSSLLFDPTNPISIKNAISHLLSLTVSDLKVIGEQNREQARKLFDKEDIVQSYLQLLS
jgi:glycosyltransferase involved in cell wall biosynthesis